MAKPEKRRRWRKKRTGFGAAVDFLREYEQKKAGTARGSVTWLTMPLVQEGQGGAIQALQLQCFFVARNAEHQAAKLVAKVEKRRRLKLSKQEVILLKFRLTQAHYNVIIL